MPPAPSLEPPREVNVSIGVASALLRAQHPDLAELPIVHVEDGWDNAVFRLGQGLGLRLPRRALGAELILNEQLWLPRIAADLPLRAPVPVREGRPGDGFPWSWSVVPWFHGSPADLSPPAPGAGEVLARFLKALHQTAPPDAPPNPYRGGPLADRAATFEDRFGVAAAAPDAREELLTTLRRAWAAAQAAPAWAGPPIWLHGDLHGRNLIVANGRLAAVIDWGDLTAGDPAYDLATLWMTLPERADREAALRLYAPNESMVARARGWAAMISVMLLPVANNPRMPAMARAIGARLAAGP